MYYRIPVHLLPEIRSVSTHTRKTVWSCSHTENVLIFIHNGGCRFVINEKTINLAKGHLLFIPAEQNYTRYPITDNTECTMSYIYFKTATPIETAHTDEIRNYFTQFEENIAQNILSPSVIFQELEKEIFVSNHLDTAELYNDFCHSLEVVTEQLKKHQRYGRLYSSSRLMEMLSIIGQISLSDYRSSMLSTHIKHPVPLEKAIVYITKNYRKKITMTELSKYCNVSPQHLIRLFRTHLNVTPVQYINRNKIDHSIEMLMTTDLSISEISYALGFNDPGYFSRLFKKTKGRSPNEERFRIKNYSKKT